MKKIILINFILFSTFSIAQESETPLFNKNLLSAGLGTELNIPLKSAYGTTYYFNASPLLNIDYTFLISNHYEYAFGINLNAEFGERTIEYSIDYALIESNTGNYFAPSDWRLLERIREGDLYFSLGLNYYRRLSLKHILFFNLDIIPATYIFNYSSRDSWSNIQTGVENSYWFFYNHYHRFYYPYLIQYKMGLILPNSHFKLMPFIELPLYRLSSNTGYSNLWRSTRNYLPGNPILFFNISIGCNLVF